LTFPTYDRSAPKAALRQGDKESNRVGAGQAIRVNQTNAQSLPGQPHALP